MSYKFCLLHALSVCSKLKISSTVRQTIKNSENTATHTVEFRRMEKNKAWSYNFDNTIKHKAKIYLNSDFNI